MLKLAIALTLIVSSNCGGQQRPVTCPAPYVVSIMVNSTHKCSGSLIDNDLVLTAANCFYNLNDGWWHAKVIVGSDTFSVVDRIVNDKFDGDGEHDIALLRLGKNVTLSSYDDFQSHMAHGIYTIKLASKNATTGDQATLEWCSSPTTGEYGTQHNVTLTNNRSQYTNKTLRYICASLKGCKVDHGAPLVINGELYGIVSNCDKNTLCSTSVPHCLDWIEESSKLIRSGFGKPEIGIEECFQSKEIN